MSIFDDNTLHSFHSKFSTPLIVDASLRMGLSIRIAPFGIRPLLPEMSLVGQIVTVRHYGSADILLEAIATSKPGEILVIDNGGRTDEACIGDLIALEAKAHQLSGIVLWGCHRDTTELIQIGLPIFSYGTYPAAPRRLDPRSPDALSSAHFGDFQVSREDLVFADRDGVMFVPFKDSEELFNIAHAIWQKERQQSEALCNGETLIKQFRFDEYLNQRATDSTYTFRKHLRNLNQAIEE
jgi:4-hydroxy-4-methyl-2-oxoglutarate aldolase